MTDKTKLAAINPWDLPGKTGTSYPAPHGANCMKREKRALGDVFGLTQFGVNLVRLQPGQISAQRHWHSHEDEFVMVLRGKLVLITDAGEQEVGPGMVAGFAAGVPNGHHFVNRGTEDAVYLEIGSRVEGDGCDYPDIDMLLRYIDGDYRFVHKDGTPYRDG